MSLGLFNVLKMAYDDRVMQCDTNANKSFPIQMGLTVTDTMYDTVSEPIIIDFQWASRSTPPKFTNNSIIDEVGPGQTNLSTLRYNRKNYTIARVQIIQASHTAWILPNTAQKDNKEDIVITFSNEDIDTSGPNTPYILFVIPIIRTSSNASINYLKGLTNPSASGPFSLQSCFPTNKKARFAYYSTCLESIGKNTPTQNMNVFVAVNGISISASLMENILTNVGVSFSASMSPLYTNRITNISRTISSMESFTQYVMSTTDLMNYASFAKLNIDSNIRTDNVGAYQCVQVDPDSIVNGQIQVDISTGEVLKDVLSNRDAIRDTHLVQGTNAENRFINYFHSGMGIFMAVILSLILCIIIVYVVFSFAFKKIDAPDTSFLWAMNFISSSFYVKYVLLFLIAGFIGFIIGTLIN
jgi:hypothetical protein